MKLTREQRNLLVRWAAEGLRLPEINERAAGCDPPFRVEWEQLKHARTKFAATFTRFREEFESQAISEGLSRKAARLRQLEQVYDLHLELIQARGKEMAGEIAGGATGLMVRDYKGKDADTPVYKYDAALIREMRGMLDDIAREMGDRKNNVDITTKGQPLTFANLAQLATDEQSSPSESDPGTKPE